ncbi:MAG: hypothetical protein AAFQ83_23675 [Bacteroidota bacterium]
MKLLLYIPAFSVLIPLILGISTLRHHTISIKRLVIFLICCTLMDLTSHVLTDNHINTTPTIHFYTILEFTFFIRIIGPHAHARFQARGTYILSGGFALLTGLNMLFFQPLIVFPSYILFLECITLILISLLYYKRLLDEMKVEQLTRSSIFWVVNAIFFYFSINLFMYLLSNYLETEVYQIAWVIIHNLNYLLRNILFTLGIWYSRKSSLES